MKKLFGLIFISLLFLLAAGSSAASDTATCQTIYGGGQTVYGGDQAVYGRGQGCPTKPTFTINKLVQSPVAGGPFVENLTLNDPLFEANQNIIFQIKVKNIGDLKIDSIDITDIFPANVKFVAGPGTYNEANNTLTIRVENLESGKEAIYFITAAFTSSAVPCATNRVQALSNNGATDDDSTNFCIKTNVPLVEKKVIVTSIPSTGPEAFVLFPFLASGAAGFFLRKREDR